MIEVFAMVPWPGCHSPKLRASPHSAKYQKPKAIGDIRFSLGNPCKPAKEWTCGTDVVWPVHFVNGEEIEDYPLPYVCRHQIVAGD